jgi:DNA polymerase-1
VIAVVMDQPRPDSRVAAGVLQATFDAVGVVDVEYFYAVDATQPGGKPPPIALVREQRDRLAAELRAARPAKILSCGAGALSSLAGAAKALPISKHRGRMRLWEGVPWVPTISPGSVVASSDLFRDLANDVYKAWNQDAPLPPPEVFVRVVSDAADLKQSLDLIEGASVVAIDVETTGLRPWRDELLAVGIGALAVDGLALVAVVPRALLGDDDVKDLVWHSAFRSSRRSVGHNYKFDLQFLLRWLGEDRVPDGAILGDTMLLAHLLDERPNRDNTRSRGLGLKDLAAVRYDVDYGWDFEAFYAAPDAERDWDGLHEYLGMDVATTARLWHDLYAEARSESLGLIQAHDVVVAPAFATMAGAELAGAPVDAAWLHAFARWLRRRGDRRGGCLARLATELGAPEGFSHGAPLQVADLMYDVWRMTPDARRKKGLAVDAKDRSTDKDHVKAAVAKYRVRGGALWREAGWLQSLLRWRADAKNASTYSETLLDRADDLGRVHADFRFHGTSTGRLSSSSPNLQNIPALDRNPDASRAWPPRRAFAPRAGSAWVEADYANLELRVAAWLSGDEALGEVFREGKDIHLEVASTMFGKAPERISKAERFLAKAVDFGILFGRTPRALAQGVEMDYLERELGGRRWTTEQADLFMKAFMRGYPRLRDWIAETGEAAVAAHYVETPFGRRRRFPLGPRTKYETWEIQRQAVNTPIQSAASDLCLQAMARVAGRLPEGARILFPVHDSICLEVEETLVADVARILREEMEIVVGDVPLTIDVESGPTWADMKEVPR